MRIKKFNTVFLFFLVSICAYTFAEGNTPPPGKLVEVNGHKLHINCAGNGTPIVVLESAIGGWSVDWEKVQPLVAKKTRICSYDRAGYGWSEPRDEDAVSSQLIADELHQLFINAQEAGPYLMVGHSLGGLHVQAFVHTYPKEVVGAVLVDATHEDVFTWEAPTYWNPPKPDVVPPEPEFDLNLIKWTPETRKLIDQSREDPQWQATTQKESQGIRDSVLQLREFDKLPNIPLIVLTAGEEKKLEDYWSPRDLMWNQLQRDLATLSPRSEHIHVPGSIHYIQLDNPEIVANSINRIVDITRKSEKTDVIVKFNQ